MKNVIVTITLLMTLPALIGADESDLEKENPYLKDIMYDARTLHGLDGICVSVVVHPKDFQKVGLIEDQLKTSIELKLHQAGINVLKTRELIELPYSGLLTLFPGFIFNESGLVSYHLNFDLVQTVYLERGSTDKKTISKLKTNASTWHKDGMDIVEQSGLSDSIRNKVDNLTDAFINDYRKANPSK